MAMMGMKEKAEIPGVGATTQRIGQDVVYLDQVS